MPAYHVERSIRIDAEPSQVLPALNDFSAWPHWSPWLCMERTARVEVFGTPGETDHGYRWDGELVGAGSMQLNAATSDRLDMGLFFLRPFKSQASVRIDIAPIGSSQTEVTWHMDGKMPIFLFFMTGMMKTMIGADYERGLKMLKEYVETGAVTSQTEIMGIVEVPETHFLGVEAHCAMDEIGESMKESLPAAFRYASEHDIALSGCSGAIYHKVDIKNRQCHYTAIVQTKSKTMAQEVRTGTIPACRALKVVHTGDYVHLGNAWSTAMAYQRHHKLKLRKAQPGFELYPNDPGEHPAKDWITEIYIPIRNA